MRSAADSTLLAFEEAIHHLANGQDVDRLSSVGLGSEFDVSLLCQLQRLVQTCWRWIRESPVGVLQDEAVPAFGFRIVEVDGPSPTALGVPKDIGIVSLAAL